MQTTLPDHDLVLLGVGHTNAHVLRQWIMNPIPNVRLTCISPFPMATYSGMLPGVLAGLYPPEAMTIDLVRLCASAGARLVLDEVRGLDRERRELIFDRRPPVSYDVLSIGIGSRPCDPETLDPAANLVRIKPMQTFLDRLSRAVMDYSASGSIRVSVVGGGAGGAEVAMALPQYFARQWPGMVPTISLITASANLVPGMSERSAAQIGKRLAQAAIEVRMGEKITAVHAGSIESDQGSSMPSDLVIWATAAGPPTLVENLSLPRDSRGFVRTKPTLQSVADERIFVVGDTASIDGEDLPKAGVYAVRQSPILWSNIRHVFAGRPMQTYRPQRRFLKLLSTGDGQAVGEFHGVTFSGRWTWLLKDRIDRRFMTMFQTYPPPMSAPTDQDPGSAMRCAGCGGKVPGHVLQQVIQGLDVTRKEGVVLGLERADDAAVLELGSREQVVVSTDFFAAPFDEPYLLGRLAALHAMSDLDAMNARPTAAMAHLEIPTGSIDSQSTLMSAILRGSRDEFADAGATIVGGHTIEGPRVVVGFTVVGEPRNGHRTLKSGLRVGDQLYLTKPIGTGILLAAHMRAECQADWWSTLIETMLRPNSLAVRYFGACGVQAATDVTGFGLAGHLMEMLLASNVAAEIEMKSVPILPGALELSKRGIESSIASANRRVESQMQLSHDVKSSLCYPLLFDPQTGGGLLLAIPKGVDPAEQLSSEVISEIGLAKIGVVTEFDGGARLRVV